MCDSLKLKLKKSCNPLVLEKLPILPKVHFIITILFYDENNKDNLSVLKAFVTLPRMPQSDVQIVQHRRGLLEGCTLNLAKRQVLLKEKVSFT